MSWAQARLGWAALAGRLGAALALVVGPKQERATFQRLRRWSRPAWLGTIRRTQPLSDHFGSDRGQPVDRLFIESFLARNRLDIHGVVLEVKDSRYVRRYGSQLARVEVLDVESANPLATVVADLARADSIASDEFDCFVLTQTLQFIFDLPAAVFHARRILRPGGVLLATLPAVGRIEPDGAFTGGRRGVDEDYWRFTVASARRLFGDVFGPAQVTVSSYGNVLTAVAFLMGMAREELSVRELAAHDASYPVMVAIRAVK